MDNNSTQEVPFGTQRRGFIKGVSGNPGGMPKGLKDLYAKIRNEFGEAYYELGGFKSLVKWIENKPKNKAQFYEMLIKLMPKQIIGEGFNQGTKILIVTSEEAKRIEEDVKDNPEGLPKEIPAQ